MAEHLDFDRARARSDPRRHIKFRLLFIEPVVLLSAAKTGERSAEKNRSGGGGQGTFRENGSTYTTGNS